MSSEVPVRAAAEPPIAAGEPPPSRWRPVLIDAVLAAAALTAAVMVFNRRPAPPFPPLEITADSSSSARAAAVVRIDADSGIWWDTEPLADMAALAEQADKLRRQQPAAVAVRLAIHPQAFCRTVVQALDALRQAGWEKLLWSADDATGPK